MVSRPRKPTFHDLGIDVNTLTWQRSGEGADAIEVAFTEARGAARGRMRLAGDTGGPIHVFDTDEWDCFVEAAKQGEFDDMQAQAKSRSRDL